MLSFIPYSLLFTLFFSVIPFVKPFILLFTSCLFFSTLFLTWQIPFSFLLFSFFPRSPLVISSPKARLFKRVLLLIFSTFLHTCQLPFTFFSFPFFSVHRCFMSQTWLFQRVSIFLRLSLMMRILGQRKRKKIDDKTWLWLDCRPGNAACRRKGEKKTVGSVKEFARLKMQTLVIFFCMNDNDGDDDDDESDAEGL